MSDWYYSLDNRQHGPISKDELLSKAASGSISADTLVWKEGMENWSAYSKVEELQTGQSPAAQAGDASATVQPSASTAVASVQPQVESNPYAHPQAVQPAPGMPQNPYAPKRNDGNAVASLVCGICSVFCGIFTAIPAVICGHIALKNIRNNPEQLDGRGMAIAGLVIGYIMIAIMVIYILVLVAAAATA